MTPEQITMLREDYLKEATKPNGKKSTLAEYVKFALDGGITFVTSKDFVVFDDGNTMLHCVCCNPDPYSQADFPIKVFSSEYNMVQQVEAIFSNKNFERLLNEGSIGQLLSDEKKKFMLEWAKTIRNQAQQPIDADPYYTQNPRVIPMPTSVIKRDDGIEHATEPATLAWTNDLIPSVKEDGTIVANSPQAFALAMESAEDGAVIELGSSIITGTLTLDKSVTIVGNGTAKVQGNVVATASDVTLENIVFDYVNPESAGNKGSVVAISGENLNLTGCSFDSVDMAYNILNVDCTGEIVIKDCTFKGDNVDNMHNVIEFSSKVDISKVSIENCKFYRNAANNNCISFYKLADGASITIRDCWFENSANAVRISNYGNATGVVVDVIDCEYESTPEEWPGFMLFQSVKGESFGGITINFNNLRGPDGTYITENGTGTDTVWYTYGSKTDFTNPDNTPVVAFTANDKVSVEDTDSLLAVIEAAEEGSTIVFSNVSVDEPIVIEKAITLKSDGIPISSPITMTIAAPVILDGFDFTCEEIYEDGKGSTIKVIGSELTMTGCKVDSSVGSYNMINVEGENSVINITDTEFFCNAGNAHNGIELAGVNGSLKEVNIKNCKFHRGNVDNNWISMYRFEEGAVINIENCWFEYAANAVRISNYDNVSNVTINVTNCTYEGTSNDNWAGFMLFQEVKSESFAGINVNFKNLVGPNGQVMLENGTGSDQVYYYYYNHKDLEPTVANVTLSA